jgi:hypothetical protein
MRLPGLTDRRLILALAVALATATSATLTAFASHAAARAHKTACSSVTPAHHARLARACARRAHPSGSRVHAKKSRRHHRSRRSSRRTTHHAARRSSKRSSKHHQRKRRHARHKSTPHPAGARCEDGSAPKRNLAGLFSCGDSSEPACPDGAQPVLSHDDRTLLCVIASSKAAEAEAEAEEEEGEGEEEEGEGEEEGEEGYAGTLEEAGGPGEGLS